MCTSTGLRRRPAGRGFTLVELLLTLSLILLMAGAVVLNFESVQSGSELDEGATQIESLFRYARAEAASSGRTVRIVFGDSDSNTNAAPSQGSIPRVMWETDPIGTPGRFEELPNARSFTAQLDDLIQVQAVRASPAKTNEVAIPNTDPGAETVVSETGPDSSPLAPVVFYPDGSSDSVELVLVAPLSQDRRRMVVKLSGITGALRRQILQPDELGQVVAEGLEFTK